MKLYNAKAYILFIRKTMSLIAMSILAKITKDRENRRLSREMRGNTRRSIISQRKSLHEYMILHKIRIKPKLLKNTMNLQNR